MLGLVAIVGVDVEASDEHAARLGNVGAEELLGDLVDRLEELAAGGPQIGLEVEAGLEDGHQDLLHLLVLVGAAARVCGGGLGLLCTHLLQLKVEDLLLDLGGVFPVEGVLLVDDVVERAPQRPNVHFLSQVHLLHNQLGG